MNSAAIIKKFVVGRCMGLGFGFVLEFGYNRRMALGCSLFKDPVDFERKRYAPIERQGVHDLLARVRENVRFL